MGTIIHGNKNFGYAPIVISGNDYSFGTPVMLKGMTKASAELSEEQIGIPADDNPNYAVVNGAKVETLSASFRYIPETYSELLGFKKATNGMLCDTGVYPNHCVFFEEQIENTDNGTTTRKLHYFYQVKGSRPKLETTTDTETIEAREIEVAYKVQKSDFVVDEDGIEVQHCEITRTDANADLYDRFTQEVILPTSPIASI